MPARMLRCRLRSVRARTGFTGYSCNQNSGEDRGPRREKVAWNQPESGPNGEIPADWRIPYIFNGKEVHERSRGFWLSRLEPPDSRPGPAPSTRSWVTAADGRRWRGSR